MANPTMTNPIPNPQTPDASRPDPVSRYLANLDRDRANKANALLSTGPRTAAGKQRSSQNALTHGLTAASPVLATEDLAAYQLHCRQFHDEYQPATPTETQLTRNWPTRPGASIASPCSKPLFLTAAPTRPPSRLA